MLNEVGVHVFRKSLFVQNGGHSAHVISRFRPVQYHYEISNFALSCTENGFKASKTAAARAYLGGDPKRLWKTGHDTSKSIRNSLIGDRPKCEGSSTQTKRLMQFSLLWNRRCSSEIIIHCGRRLWCTHFDA